MRVRPELRPKGRPAVQYAKVPTFSGHVFRREGVRGPVWYAKYRLPDGRQRQRRIGPAWTKVGRPAAGTYTRRTARAALADLLDMERERYVPGSRLPELTFAEAAREWLRYVDHDRACKPSTMRGYRSSVNGLLIPAFGDLLVAEITPADIERWRATLTTAAPHAEQIAGRAARHLPPRAAPLWAS
jgi:hypothetical protein